MPAARRVPDQSHDRYQTPAPHPERLTSAWSACRPQTGSGISALTQPPSTGYHRTDLDQTNQILKAEPCFRENSPGTPDRPITTRIKMLKERHLGAVTVSVTVSDIGSRPDYPAGRVGNRIIEVSLVSGLIKGQITPWHRNVQRQRMAVTPGWQNTTV